MKASINTKSLPESQLHGAINIVDPQKMFHLHLSAVSSHRTKVLIWGYVNVYTAFGSETKNGK